MTPALPLTRGDTFLEEHRRIRQKLIRLRKFTRADARFPSVLNALVACLDEIEGLLPELVDHFDREERLLRGRGAESLPPGTRDRAEQVFGEHRPLLRELRVLGESGRRLVEEFRAGRESNPAAQALVTYLAACVQDLLQHEEAKREFLAEPEPEKS